MKDFLLIFIVGFFMSTGLSAQIKNVYIGNGSSSLILESTGDYGPAGFNDLYMNPDWKMGTVITKKKALIKNLGLRYNVTSGQFEVVSVLNPDLIKRINLDGKVFVYTSYLNKGKKGRRYFQLLSEGKTHLLLARYVSRKAGKKGLYGYDPYQTIEETYYLQKGNQPAVPIKRNKKSILSLLADQKAKVEAFLRNNNLSFFNVNDIGKLLRYYDSLNAQSKQ